MQISVYPSQGPDAAGLTGAQASTIGIGFNNTNSFTANVLYLLFVCLSWGGADPTISSTTATWDLVVKKSDGSRWIGIYRMMPTSNLTNETVAVHIAFPGASGFSVGLFKATGVPTGSNGANAIVQSISGNGSGADPTLTFASNIKCCGNHVAALFMNDSNPFTGTPESGYVELYDLGYTPPTSGAYYMKSDGPTTDNTPSVTASASNWVGVAIEVNGFLEGLYPYYF